MDKTIHEAMLDIIRTETKGTIIMAELPTENYFEASSSCVKALIDHAYGGVYISFQRPFPHIKESLQEKGINTDKLLFIDVATAFAKGKITNDPQCTHISQAIDVNELVRAIYLALEQLEQKEKFIFIDSISTITLFKPLSETLRFSEFLIRTTKKYKDPVHLIFNVAKELSQKKFIKDIALRVNKIIPPKND